MLTRIKASLSVLIIVLFASHVSVAQSSGTITGTSSDTYVLNNNNSNHYSRLRLQTNSNAFNIMNNGTNLELRSSTSTNHNDLGTLLWTINRNTGNLTLKNDAKIYGADLIQGYNDLRFKPSASSSMAMTMYTTGKVSAHHTFTVGTTTLVSGTVMSVDGRVYISEEGGSEAGFDNTADSNYQDYLLWVEEGVVSKDFAVADVADWPDYVFEEGYDLKSLNQIESFINTNGHLPTMPAASTVEEKGLTISDMTKRMVQTIEELTLHTIDQQKKIDTQQSKIDNQQLLIERLSRRLEKLEKTESQN